MSRLYAQGDILIERIDTGCAATGKTAQCFDGGSIVVAEGEATGHQHRLFGSVTMYRDDALAHDVPSGLYVAHVRIHGLSARLVHQEHGSITLARGMYRVRRQRQLEPVDEGFREDATVIED